MDWIKFIRHYGPISRNDNMYDETIQPLILKYKIKPIEFEHPLQNSIFSAFRPLDTSIILTGTAGDGKTHICRKIWESLGGNPNEWASKGSYFTSTVKEQNITIHFIRDLSEWSPQQGATWSPEKQNLLERLCSSVFTDSPTDIFIIAGNDGQIVETWRRLPDSECTVKLRKIIETLLVEEKEGFPGVRLKLFNLSRGSSAKLFDSIIGNFLEHPGWQECFHNGANTAGLYGTNCPIRINYELLRTPLVQSRIRALLELCDLNGLHVPIRQILLLLANAILGHPDVKDHLMSPAEVPTIIAQNTCAKASVYNNIFGGNLSDARKQSITIFDYFDHFQIGHETCNRIDNLLIYGETDENFQYWYEKFIKNDIASGSNDFISAKHQYVECADEDEERSRHFLQLLIFQRRGLFFKIPLELEKDLGLWELTVFKFAGEYLNEVVGCIRQRQEVDRSILYRLIKGLNRIFTGMLINSEREIFLASNGNYSQGRISRIMIDRVSVNPNKGERIVWGPQTDYPTLQVYLAQDMPPVEFVVNLTRYEFLSRVASEGALPASFSKECYEDILAFKSMLITAALNRPFMCEKNNKRIDLRILSVGINGVPEEKYLEVKL